MPTLENKIMEKLGVDTKHLDFQNITRKIPKKQPMKEHYQILSNYFYQMDLMIMTPYNNYKYLFVIVNMRTRLTDVWPLKDKEAHSVLHGFKEILKRNVIEKYPKVIFSDQGSEFKNKLFETYCKNNDIKLVFTRVKNKKQNSIVEMTNNFYGKYLGKYLSYKWQQKNKIYNNWIDILYVVRDEYNAHNKEIYPKHFNYLAMQPDLTKNRFNVGDFVYVKTDNPKRVLTEENEHGYSYRHGDLRFGYDKHKIIGISRANGRNLRYVVEDSKGKKVFGTYLDHEMIGAGDVIQNHIDTYKMLLDSVDPSDIIDYILPVLEHYVRYGTNDETLSLLYEYFQKFLSDKQKNIMNRIFFQL